MLQFDAAGESEDDREELLAAANSARNSRCMSNMDFVLLSCTKLSRQMFAVTSARIFCSTSCQKYLS